MPYRMPQFFTINIKTKFTRRGVSYIISKYVVMAKKTKDFHTEIVITPHVFRHSRAAHMLQAGINLVYIRDFLGTPQSQAQRFMPRHTVR